MRRPRIQPRPFRTVAVYQTSTGKEHVVQVIAGLPGYTVATSYCGFVVPNSISRVLTYDEAVQEIENRARLDASVASLSATNGDPQ